MLSALRLPFATGSGALVTLALFSVLWHFVSAPVDVGTPVATTEVNFTKMRKDTPVVTKREEKTQRPTPPSVPSPPKIGGDPGGPPTPATFVRTRVETGALPKHGGLPLPPDGDVIPIVRVAPDYPPAALARGLEGWVQVRFTVSASGSVQDAVVVAAEPPKMFDAAALKAIGRWRYKPMVANGAAVERVGLQTIIRFDLQ
jgi:protein TonB